MIRADALHDHYTIEQLKQAVRNAERAQHDAIEKTMADLRQRRAALEAEMADIDLKLPELQRKIPIVQWCPDDDEPTSIPSPSKPPVQVAVSVWDRTMPPVPKNTYCTERLGCDCPDCEGKTDWRSR